MQFLADESCDYSVVRALQAAGHDVKEVREISPGAADEKVIDIAINESLVLLTEDKDFGQLFFASVSVSPGVILI
jgi:predicted nuclease of predicted toxin-antitoxin system